MVRIKLSRNQFQYLASASRTLAEGIILGTLAAFFLPEVFQMKESISIFRFSLFLIAGNLFLAVGVILQERGKK